MDSTCPALNLISNGRVESSYTFRISLLSGSSTFDQVDKSRWSCVPCGIVKFSGSPRRQNDVVRNKKKYFIKIQQMTCG